mgnify:CR=1 FL=1|tara:strand:+ start:32357 stop:32773 length:417 start_codon:yes stop_codon:yes gene_type:complete
MRIIGFNLTGISSERKDKIEGELKISQNINLIEIIKEKLTISSEESLHIKFQFTVNYDPDIAKIEFKGNVILLPEKEDIKKILKSWKSKKLGDEFRIPLFNFIMGKCNIKALNLEDEFGLPPHIQMPRISPDQDKPIS